MAELFETLNSWWSYEFVRRALVATSVMSFSVAPIGCFLVLRRLSLAGEALAHAIVPGIAIAFLISGGLSVVAMLVGGLLSGLAVALSATLMARISIIREDAGLASLYIIALALGVFVLSVGGSGVPLKSFLFGKILGLGNSTLVLIGVTTTVTLVALALMLRPLIVSTLDPSYFESRVGKPWVVQLLFMLLMVLNLIASFRALGTLMAVGLMILPATSARYWTTTLSGYVLLAIGFALCACWVGIGLSLVFPNIPTGPCIILVAGALFFFSLVLGPNGLRSSSTSS